MTIETRAATSRGGADAREVEFTRLYTGECDRMRRLAYLMTGQLPGSRSMAGPLGSREAGWITRR